jgi:putative peptide zinc metalloprotease protein
MRRLILLVVFAVLFGAAPAHAQGDTTAAIAVNTKDGASLFDFAFQVRKTMKDAVEHTNAAVAYANCTECSTVAISFQVVLAGGDPDSVTPTNIAVALNEECASCLTAAFAYQFVIAGDGHMRLTGEGQRRLAELRQDLRALEDTDLTIEQLQAELDSAADEIRDVLATELVSDPRRREDEEEVDEDPAADSDDAVPEGTVTPEPTETPTPTATPSATPEPTATATP